jgi:DNA-binding NarL/FixJ family response regulator
LGLIRWGQFCRVGDTVRDTFSRWRVGVLAQQLDRASDTPPVRGSRCVPRLPQPPRGRGRSRSADFGCGRMLGRVAIRLVLAEDSYLVREGIRRLLETRPELELVDACGDLDSLLGAVETERPDAVLTDIRMPPAWHDEGIQAAQRLRDTSPQVGVIVLSQYADPGYALALLESGSERRAYLLKERVEDLDQLVSTIRAVAAGGSVIDPKVVETLVEAKTADERSRLSELTPREHEVMREMAQGRNNAGIAESLVITERSVEKYVHSIFAKLGLTWEEKVHRRVKAVLLYLGED